MKQHKFGWKARIKSFSYAFNGLRILFQKEPNAKIHAFAGLVVVCLGFLLGISKFEWMVLVSVTGVVFAMELVNTAIENLSDFFSPAKNEKIGFAKDTAAAAVLVCCITAVIVGAIIFVPKIIALIS